jgi:hypothetical protein
MNSAHAIFAEACRSAFLPLVTQYEFSKPDVESIGRECFVRFHKGAKTVSVAWEAGSDPIVELFYPAGPNDQVTPWAARSAVPYSRRIPRIDVRLRYDPNKPDTASTYLAESMKQLADTERSFLEVKGAV